MTGPGHSRTEVLVGVDCSPGSAAALRFAEHEAQLRDAGLVVLLSIAAPDRHGKGPCAAGAIGNAERELRRFCRAEVTSAVDVEPVVTLLPAERALVERSADAELLVVGAPRVGWSPPTVPAACLRWAQCPVAVVRPSGGPPRPGPVEDEENAARYL